MGPGDGLCLASYDTCIKSMRVDDLDLQPLWPAGHGRSCTVLCAALMDEGSAETIDEALAIVRKTRPLAKLGSNQRKSLEEWLELRKRAK